MAECDIAAEVEFHSTKNCFITVRSNSLFSNSSDGLTCFKISKYSNNEQVSIYAAGNVSRANESRIVFNGIFASFLKLERQEQVFATVIDEPPTCICVSAEPVLPGDWDVVSLNAAKIEEQLLQQIRVVYVGLQFPYWVDGGFHVLLRIVSCEPSGGPCALLVESTEVIIGPGASKISSPKPATIKSTIDDQNAAQENAQILMYEAEELLHKIPIFDAILEKFIDYVDSYFSADKIRIGFPILIGPTASGKTYLSKVLSLKRLPEKDIFTSLIDCRSLKGKTPESLEKTFAQKILEAVQRQPAVIILDDIDDLCSACNVMEQITPGAAMLFEKISRLVAAFITDVRRHDHQVVFFATATSFRAVHQHLTSPRGTRFFDMVISIPDLDYINRKAALSSIIFKYVRNETLSSTSRAAVSWLAKRSEGYVLADLVSLVERASVFSNSEDRGAGNEFPTIAQFKTALEGFVPLNLSGNQTAFLKMAKEHSLKNVGGLANAKEILEKIFHFPTKYPQVFSSLPIRLPRGVLLYGPSGCGKTLLAAAVAGEYNINLLNVKGAELLSKYIGASEEAVRHTFSRAKTMKPCLIFFDEFDALAPRRGHDSTGVTDRVVNQLLTEMDGVERLEGVFVMTASSRPDLIDPALLRPGRIDKRIYCGMPSEVLRCFRTNVEVFAQTEVPYPVKQFSKVEDDRLDILRRLSSPLCLSKDVDLAYVACRTEHFSGADLKSLLLDAHFSALRDATADVPERTSDTVSRIPFPEISFFAHFNGDGNFSTCPSQQTIQETLEMVNESADNFYHSYTPEGEVCSERPLSQQISINNKHLVAALASARPSVSAQERLRFEKMYANFVPNSEAVPMVNAQDVGNRVTLA